MTNIIASVKYILIIRVNHGTAPVPVRALTLFSISKIFFCMFIFAFSMQSLPFNLMLLIVLSVVCQFL